MTRNDFIIHTLIPIYRWIHFTISGFIYLFRMCNAVTSVRIACQCKHTHLKFTAFYIEFSINKLHPATFYALRTVFRSIPPFIRNCSSRCLALSLFLCAVSLYLYVFNYVIMWRVCLCARLLILNVARDVNYHHFASNFAGFFSLLIWFVLSRLALFAQRTAHFRAKPVYRVLWTVRFYLLQYWIRSRASTKAAKKHRILLYRPINCAVCVRVRSRDT